MENLTYYLNYALMELKVSAVTIYWVMTMGQCFKHKIILNLQSMHHYLHSAGLSATSGFFPLLSQAKLHYQKWFRGTVAKVCFKEVDLNFYQAIIW